MMKTVSFYNKGILDATSIATFGINVKDNDNAIGYFGTGLKYAIAVILREGCIITINTGHDSYVFTKVDTVVRGKTFGVIHMNGVALGFTTELGKNWKMWQAFRELYCNAFDEDGSVTQEDHEHDLAGTTVCVTGEEFFASYLGRSSIVLDTEEFIKHERCSVHRGTSSYVYYKTVRIYDGLQIGKYTYNIHRGLAITEDRTAKYEHNVLWSIADAIVTSTNRDFIEDVLLADGCYLEHDLDLSSSYAKPSDVFLDVAEALRLNIAVNTSIFQILAKYKRLPQIAPMELNSVQKEMLRRAIKFCKDIGYMVDAYPIVTSGELKGGLHGLAEKSTIYLSPETFGMGTKYLASTLIEEYLHLHTGYGDLTRDLQSMLFNDIVSLGERLLGEPV